MNDNYSITDPSKSRCIGAPLYFMQLRGPDIGGNLLELGKDGHPVLLVNSTGKNVRVVFEYVENE